MSAVARRLCGAGGSLAGIAAAAGTLRWAAAGVPFPRSLPDVPAWAQRTALADVVTAAALAGGAVLAGYLGLVVLLAVVADCAGGRGLWWRGLALRLAPGIAGRLVRLALGVAVISGTVVPGTASAGSAVTAPRGAMAGEGAAQLLPAGGSAAFAPLLDRPATGPTAVPDKGPAPTGPRHPMLPGAVGHAGADTAVVVRRGDTLWSIAERHLRSGSQRPVDQRAVAAEWPRWYAVNRPVIGDDPSLLLPGQRLVPPPRALPVR